MLFETFGIVLLSITAIGLFLFIFFAANEYFNKRAEKKDTEKKKKDKNENRT